jgi:hypothetical protein
MDLKIASIALVNDALLVSANARDFGLVPDRRCENWLQAPNSERRATTRILVKGRRELTGMESRLLARAICTRS